MFSSIFSLLMLTAVLRGRYYYPILYLRKLRNREDQVMAKGNVFSKIQGQDSDSCWFNGKPLLPLLDFFFFFFSAWLFSISLGTIKAVRRYLPCIPNNTSTCHTWPTRGLSHTYTCIHSPPKFPPIQTATQHWQSSLCCAVGPCWSSILSIGVCTWQSQTP